MGKGDAAKEEEVEELSYLSDSGNHESERERNLGDIHSVGIIGPHDAAATDEHQDESSHQLCYQSSPDILVSHVVYTDHSAHS